MKKKTKEFVTDVEFEEKEIECFRKAYDILYEADKNLVDGFTKDKIHQGMNGLMHFIDQYMLKGWDFI